VERKDWTLRVYKADRRCKTGERQVNTYLYSNWTASQMAAEVQGLRRDLYRNADGWRLDFVPRYATVKSLMNGKEVQIREEARGTCCDPSTETFWSM